MGCPIESLEKLEKILAESQKDWCLVILLDRENRSPAGRQMDNLVEDLDEDSGFVYDFYLPGYDDSEYRKEPLWDHERSGRIEKWSFDRRAFRRIYRWIGQDAEEAWQYLGDCEMLLFQTRRRDESHNLSHFARYNLDDVVKNGNTVMQFLRRLNVFLQGAGEMTWEETKCGVDEIYGELILPPKDPTDEQTQLLIRGASELAKTHPKDSYVFISYSTKDWTAARKIKSQLEKNGMPCWMAPRDIPAGTNYAYVIEQAISRCGIFLVLLSKASARSVWVHKEILFAQGRLQRADRFHAAWLEAPFDLGTTESGLGYAMVDVQIDEGLSEGDLSRITDRFLKHARIGAPESIPASAWSTFFAKHPALAADEAFSEKCAWERFDAKEWTRFLKLADVSGMSGAAWEKRVPVGDWGGLEWSHLLAGCPRWAERCDKWAQFTPADWVLLLRARPGFAGRCATWGEFKPADWRRLLKVCPEFAGRCGVLNQFREVEWAALIKFQPSLARFRRT